MPSDVSVRLTTEGDREQVLRTVREAFLGDVSDGQEEVEIVETVWALGATKVAGDLVAVADGEIVGHVLASLGSLDGRAVPGIAPLAVRPDFQGQGIGTDLMTELLHQLKQRGGPLVVVLGDHGYYGRFGFQPAGQFGIHYLSAGVSTPHFQVLQLGGQHEAFSGNYVYSWEAASA